MEPIIVKLNAQVKNLEMLLEQHKKGVDVSSSVYWTNEVLNSVVSAIEHETKADKIREKYSSLTI
jgi:hypothetical protein